METEADVAPGAAAPDKQQIVAAFKESGLSVRMFANQHGLPRSTLHRWATEGCVAAQSSSAALVEVPNLMGSNPGAYRLSFPRGMVLEVPRNFAAQELRVLVQLLLEL